jgi:hypothetical protein
MAVMDLRRAQALAEELIKTGQSKGLSREALVQQIVAESGGAGAPGTAIGVVAPQPREVTPATPAPVQQGVPLVAPKPVAEAPVEVAAEPAPERPTPQSSYRRALGSTQQQIAEVQTALAAMPANKDNILDRTRLQTRLQMLTDRAGMLEGEALATENAQIPEEVRAALENREARLGRREELLQEARARSPFEALIAGGAALAQGRRGERFTEALARGLQAGVQQYGRSRQELEEGVEGVNEARDEIVLKRYEALKQAQNEARDIIRSGRAFDKETMDLANSTEGVIQKIALGQPTLDTAVAQAQKAGVQAKYAEAEAQAGLDLTRSAAEENRRRAGDRAREMTANQVYTAEQSFVAADEKMQEALEAYKADYEQAGGDKAQMDPVKFANYRAALTRRENMRRVFEKKFGRPPADAGEMRLPDGTPAAPAPGRRAAVPGASAGATKGGAGWSAIKF